MNKKTNIILLVIDDLRADHLCYMGYKKNISPNIDNLAKESMVFTNAYSTAPYTGYSFPSMLTSTYPLDTQTPDAVHRPRVLISEVLKKEGFTTIAFSSNPHLSSYFGFDKGWDFFEDIGLINLPFKNPLKRNLKQKINFKIKKYLLSLGKRGINLFPQLIFIIRYSLYKLGFWKPSPKIKGEFLNRDLEEFITTVKNDEGPFFAFVHYMDTHYPLIPYDCYFKDRPLSYRELLGRILPLFLIKDHPSKAPIRKFAEKNIESIINLYDDAIKYVDQCIGRIVDFLKKENIYQNTIIVLTADHGEEFLEHGGSGHSAKKLYNELLHVPLLIKIPGNTGRVIDKKVSLIDLIPTLCNLVGTESDPSFKGKDIFTSKEEIIFHQAAIDRKKINNPHLSKNEKLKIRKMACQSRRWKYIVEPGQGREELYDLFQDPKEINNVAQSELDVLSRMRKKIKEFERENPPFSLLN